MRKLKDVTVEELTQQAALALLTGDFPAWALLNRIASHELRVSNRKWLQAVTEAAFSEGYQFAQQEAA